MKQQIKSPSQVSEEINSRINTAIKLSYNLLNKKSSMKDPIVLNKETIFMYTVYDHPKDFPDHYVVRCWYVNKETSGKPKACPMLYLKGTDLNHIRALLKSKGLVAIPREVNDDPVIIETYI